MTHRQDETASTIMLERVEFEFQKCSQPGKNSNRTAYNKLIVIVRRPFRHGYREKLNYEIILRRN